MNSTRLTNGLLLLIAVTSTANLLLTLLDRPVSAETFQLDTCITPKVNDKPTAFLHVVTHEPSQPISAKTR